MSKDISIYPLSSFSLSPSFHFLHGVIIIDIEVGVFPFPILTNTSKHTHTHTHTPQQTIWLCLVYGQFKVLDDVVLRKCPSDHAESSFNVPKRGEWRVKNLLCSPDSDLFQKEGHTNKNKFTVLKLYHIHTPE